MSAFLEGLRRLIEAVLTTGGYAGLALLTLLENLLPPIPSELVLPFAGSLVAADRFGFVPAVLASTLGSALGALVIYGLAAWWGEDGVRAFVRRRGRWLLLNEDDVRSSHRFFERHGRSAVFWARLLPAARSLVSVPAGLARMPLAPFLLFTTMGSLLWNSLLVGAGVLLGRNWERVLKFIDIYEGVVWALLAALVAYLLLRRSGVTRSRGEDTGDGSGEGGEL